MINDNNQLMHNQLQEVGHLTMSKLDAQDLHFQLQMIQCNHPRQTPDYGSSFNEHSEQLMNIVSCTEINGNKSAPSKPVHVKNRSSLMLQSKSLGNLGPKLPSKSAARKSFSPIGAKPLSSPYTGSCNGDTVFALDLSGVPRKREKRVKVDDRQAWIHQIASTTRDTIMQKQTEQIVAQQGMIMQLQRKIESLMGHARQAETPKLNTGEDFRNVQIHQNDDTIPEDFTQEELPQTIENLHQDRFDSILQSPPSTSYLDRPASKVPEQKKSELQTPNSRYLDSRHDQTEERIWALRSQKLNQEIEIVRLATLTPMQMLHTNNSRRYTEKLGDTRLLTDPDDQEQQSQTKKSRVIASPLTPQSVTRFSVRPTPVKSSKEKPQYVLRTSKSQLHRELEKNNEELMAEKQNELMKANGFSFKPTVLGIHSTRNLYQGGSRGDGTTTSTNILIPATERERGELVQWNHQIRKRKSQVRDQERLSYSQSQLEHISKSCRMCPGTIKILHAQGSIQRQPDELGQVVVVGSPERAGARLHQQAMQSLMNKHMQRMEVYRHRELLTEPPIAYPNRLTKTQVLISPKSKPLYNETFESFRAVAEAAAKEVSHVKPRNAPILNHARTATFQDSYGIDQSQGTQPTRNINQQPKHFTQNSYSRQPQISGASRHSMSSQNQPPGQNLPQKRDADLMRAKLNMYIRDKYSNQSVFKATKHVGSAGSCENGSRRESDIGVSQIGGSSVNQMQFNKQPENTMTEVAMLDKLTPCMKTLQGAISSGVQSSHFSPSDGNKTTLKKSHRNSLGRDYEHLPQNIKVSFDFSNLEMLKQESIPTEEGLVSPLMNLRKTSLNSQQQQDQPLYYTQHTSRSANTHLAPSAIQQLEQLRFRIPPQSQATSSSNDSFNPSGLTQNIKMSDHQVDQNNNSLVMTAVSQNSLPQNQR